MSYYNALEPSVVAITSAYLSDCDPAKVITALEAFSLRHHAVSAAFQVHARIQGQVAEVNVRRFEEAVIDYFTSKEDQWQGRNVVRPTPFSRLKPCDTPPENESTAGSSKVADNLYDYQKQDVLESLNTGGAYAVVGFTQDKGGSYMFQALRNGYVLAHDNKEGLRVVISPNDVADAIVKDARKKQSK